MLGPSQRRVPCASTQYCTALDPVPPRVPSQQNKIALLTQTYDARKLKCKRALSCTPPSPSTTSSSSASYCAWRWPRHLLPVAPRHAARSPDHPTHLHHPTPPHVRPHPRLGIRTLTASQVGNSPASGADGTPEVGPPLSTSNIIMALTPPQPGSRSQPTPHPHQMRGYDITLDADWFNRGGELCTLPAPLALTSIPTPTHTPSFSARTSVRVRSRAP